MDQPVNRIMENDDNQQYQKQTEGTSNTTIQVKTNLQYQNLCLAHSDEIQVATDLPILPRSIATSQSPSSELPTVPFTVTSEQFTDDELLEPPDPPNTPLHPLPQWHYPQPPTPLPAPATPQPPTPIPSTPPLSPRPASTPASIMEPSSPLIGEESLYPDIVKEEEDIIVKEEEVEIVKEQEGEIGCQIRIEETYSSSQKCNDILYTDSNISTKEMENRNEQSISSDISQAGIIKSNESTMGIKRKNIPILESLKRNTIEE